MLTASFGGIDAIAIDFDGTLTDSRSAHEQARLQAFSEMAWRHNDTRFAIVDPLIHEDGHRHGSSPTEIIGWVLKTAGIVEDVSDERVAQTVDLKKQLYNTQVAEGLAEMPGATDFLRKALEATNGNVAIVTTAHRETEVRPYLRRYGLNGSFSDKRIISHEDTGAEHLKPDRLAYLLALGCFDIRVRPSRMLAIEDSPNGIVAAKRVGATTVALTIAYKAREFRTIAPHLRPDYTARTFKQLSKMCGLTT